MPGLVRPALQLHLAERIAECRRRVDDDARQHEGVVLLVQVRGRAHHPVPRQVAAGLLERVDEGVGGRHAGGVVAVEQVTRPDVGAVLLEDRLEEPDAPVALPDRRRRVLAEHDRDRAVRGVLRDDRHQRRRRRDIVDEDLRLPAEARDGVERL